MNAPLSLFSAEELRASRSLSPACEKDWKTRVGTWPSDSLNLLASCGPSGWYGRTSPECCLLAKDGILAPSSGRWQNSGMGSHTECVTLSGLESPSAVVVSSLSDVLETGEVPQRFFLSPKACAGILRRAEKRGKKLPPQLYKALHTVAQEMNE